MSESRFFIPDWPSPFDPIEPSVLGIAAAGTAAGALSDIAAVFAESVLGVGTAGDILGAEVARLSGSGRVFSERMGDVAGQVAGLLEDEEISTVAEALAERNRAVLEEAAVVVSTAVSADDEANVLTIVGLFEDATRNLIRLVARAGDLIGEAPEIAAVISVAPEAWRRTSAALGFGLPGAVRDTPGAFERALAPIRDMLSALGPSVVAMTVGGLRQAVQAAGGSIAEQADAVARRLRAAAPAIGPAVAPLRRAAAEAGIADTRDLIREFVVFQVEAERWGTGVFALVRELNPLTGPLAGEFAGRVVSGEFQRAAGLISGIRARGEREFERTLRGGAGAPTLAARLLGLERDPRAVVLELEELRRTMDTDRPPPPIGSLFEFEGWSGFAIGEAIRAAIDTATEGLTGVGGRAGIAPGGLTFSVVADASDIFALNARRTMIDLTIERTREQSDRAAKIAESWDALADAAATFEQAILQAIGTFEAEAEKARIAQLAVIIGFATVRGVIAFARGVAALLSFNYFEAALQFIAAAGYLATAIVAATANPAAGVPDVSGQVQDEIDEGAATARVDLVIDINGPLSVDDRRTQDIIAREVGAVAA